jgi:hypothetical protein
VKFPGKQNASAFLQTGSRNSGLTQRLGLTQAGRTDDANTGPWFTKGNVMNLGLSGMLDENEHSNTIVTLRLEVTYG